jgi:hypothetical protein
MGVILLAKLTQDQIFELSVAFSEIRPTIYTQNKNWLIQPIEIIDLAITK